MNQKPIKSFQLTVQMEESGSSFVAQGVKRKVVREEQITLVETSAITSKKVKKTKIDQLYDKALTWEPIQTNVEIFENHDIEKPLVDCDKETYLRLMQKSDTDLAAKYYRKNLLGKLE